MFRQTNCNLHTKLEKKVDWCRSACMYVALSSARTSLVSKLDRKLCCTSGSELQDRFAVVVAFAQSHTLALGNDRTRFVVPKIGTSSSAADSWCRHRGGSGMPRIVATCGATKCEARRRGICTRVVVSSLQLGVVVHERERRDDKCVRTRRSVAHKLERVWQRTCELSAPTHRRHDFRHSHVEGERRSASALGRRDERTHARKEAGVFTARRWSGEYVVRRYHRLPIERKAEA